MATNPFGVSSLYASRIPSFSVYQDANKLWRWHIKMSTDIVAASSEGYSSKQAALDNVAKIEQHIKYFRENGKLH